MENSVAHHQAAFIPGGVGELVLAGYIPGGIDVFLTGPHTVVNLDAFPVMGHPGLFQLQTIRVGPPAQGRQDGFTGQALFPAFRGFNDDHPGPARVFQPD